MKKTQLDQAIESIEDDIAMLQAALARLKQIKAKQAPRKPVAVKAANV